MTPEMPYVLDIIQLWDYRELDNNLTIFKERNLSDENHVDGIFDPQPRGRDAVLVTGARF